jgi:hypothetical protein
MFEYFYNESMRRMTIAFGQLFNNIQIKRKDSSDNVIQSIRVPLSYAPKEKFLVRLDQQPSLDEREFSITLPRMSFEISGITYDPSRKLNRIQKFKSVKTAAEGKILDYNYMPVPYNISYTLNVFTATAEGGLQIVEQILPFFQPDYTVTVNAIPSLNIKRDVPIVLNSVNYDDSYNGDFTQRRAVIYTLGFTAKTYLFGPAKTQKVIKEVQSDVHTDTTGTENREVRITVTPNPTTADADDDFGFTTTITDFTDSKNYNPTTGEDE